MLIPWDDLVWWNTIWWMRVHVMTACPGCGHGEQQHVAGYCYTPGCTYCGWSPRPKNLVETDWVKL